MTKKVFRDSDLQRWAPRRAEKNNKPLEKKHDGVGVDVYCGTFAVATVAQVPYNTARALLFPQGGDGWINMIEAARALRYLGKETQLLTSMDEVQGNLDKVLLLCTDMHCYVWCPVGRKLFDASDTFEDLEPAGVLSWADPEYFCALAVCSGPR